MQKQKIYLPKLHAYQQGNVIGFFGKDSPFSNFYKTNFTVQLNNSKYYFNSTEQFFMFYKAIKFNDLETANTILQTQASPLFYKKLGRQVKNYNDKVWNNTRYQVMLYGCKHKFSQDQTAKEALLNTGAHILCECSPYDSIWGIKMSEKQDFSNEKLWEGQNLLGKVLMEVRHNLKAKG